MTKKRAIEKGKETKEDFVLIKKGKNYYYSRIVPGSELTARWVAESMGADYVERYFSYD